MQTFFIDLCHFTCKTNYYLNTAICDLVNIKIKLLYVHNFSGIYYKNCPNDKDFL